MTAQPTTVILQTAFPPSCDRKLSSESPLFYFHQRKTAGSSLKAAMFQAAQAANLTTYEGMQVLWKTTGPAVLAGHLRWDEMHWLHTDTTASKAPVWTSTLDAATGIWSNTTANASCLTLFRDPVARIESCWNFQYVQVCVGGWGGNRRDQEGARR